MNIAQVETREKFCVRSGRCPPTDRVRNRMPLYDGIELLSGSFRRDPGVRRSNDVRVMCLHDVHEDEGRLGRVSRFLPCGDSAWQIEPLVGQITRNRILHRVRKLRHLVVIESLSKPKFGADQRILRETRRFIPGGTQAFRQHGDFIWCSVDAIQSDPMLIHPQPRKQRRVTGYRPGRWRVGILETCPSRCEGIYIRRRPLHLAIGGNGISARGVEHYENNRRALILTLRHDRRRFRNRSRAPPRSASIVTTSNHRNQKKR